MSTRSGHPHVVRGLSLSDESGRRARALKPGRQRGSPAASGSAWGSRERAQRRKTRRRVCMHTKPPMHEMSSSHPVVIQSSISRGRFLNASSMGRSDPRRPTRSVGLSVYVLLSAGAASGVTSGWSSRYCREGVERRRPARVRRQRLRAPFSPRQRDLPTTAGEASPRPSWPTR